jgi:hypothetical protein
LNGLQRELNRKTLTLLFGASWNFGNSRDLIETGQLYFRRSDKLDDEHEGIPPEEFARQSLGLNAYDINDIQKLNNDLGSTAQFRQAFYINCWYLFDQETVGMWANYAKDGVAIVSRYSLLKTVLEPITDRTFLGLLRYGWSLGTRWNTLRFITTKREEYAAEREVRALLWLVNSGDGVNRHIDIDNRVHPRPVYDPPESLPLGVKREVDIQTLICEVVITPKAPPELLNEVQSMMRQAGLTVAVRPSLLTQYAHFLPTAEELVRYK